ncbi:MAG: hypothetical protein WC736_04115 [Gallionella sp.]|jgi:hypothetical protein
MKNILLLPGFMLLFAVMTNAYAGIYLIYDGASASPVVAFDESIDEFTVEEGYLAPRAYVSVNGSVAGSRIPLAFIPPATAYAIGGNKLMPSLILAAPSASSSPQLSRAVQGAHAWSVYQAGNNGLGLVYTPGGNPTASQKSARGNRARAQAFRLDYYR